ncbi:transglutaminase domain-containing protein [Nocardioides dongxiaopingii]|uniref:DUF3488 and transglutaminase-like domain-containing protein n=1 Tax=Nocardioides sp. S-1144 TaxID=2582905 RepID=UPI00116554F0|nr:transglutaminase domain-containing protein [Nocardioides sp. S-1144]QCW51693.2 transglutaminase domain-containing protein [Nocardioides sp. S-1144]
MRRFLPSRETAVDLGFLLALCLVALVGLATTFTGVAHLLVAVLGLVLGLALTGLVRAMRWPGIAAVTLGVPVFLGVGALVAATSVGTVADQVVGGWKELLTTLPPVQGTGEVLVLPWTLGLVAGLLGGLTVGVRSGPALLRSALGLLAPVLLLVAVILLGVARPQSLWLQGTLFAALAIGWVAVRESRRRRPVEGRRGRWRRGVVGVVLVAGAGALAMPVTSVAFGDDTGRTVLRTQVRPPFDIGQYPSPLASFRRYVEEPEPVEAENLYDETLLTLDGAPAGSRLRIATLDHYDGIVWGASEGADPSTTTDTFQRVSSTIDNPVEGDRVSVEVTVGDGYDGVWLPTVGALQELRFDAGDATTKAESWRYNLATSTAVVPTGVRPGDVYHFTAVEPDDELSPTDAPAQVVTDVPFAASFLDTQAVQWSAGASEPMERVFAIAEHLKVEGKYSDGVLQAERIYHPGHHVKRLGDEFANAPIAVGNDEQYAAVMALLANKVGVPARVVLGAVVPDDGAVQGRDVSAWVEVQLADGSWRTLPTETFMDLDRPAEQPPLAEQEMSGTVVPPPAPVPPPSTLAEQTEAELEARRIDRKEQDDDAVVAGWFGWVLVAVGGPLLLALLVVGTVAGLKGWRRRRRRGAAQASERVVGGWRELVDHARDLGRPVPVGSTLTRREQAPHVPSAAAPALARHADGLVFGPTEPDAAVAAEFWALVDAERRAMTSAATRRRRLLSVVAVRSFRRRS